MTWKYFLRYWPFVRGIHPSLLDSPLNTLRPRQNGCHFADDTFKRIFMNENVRISIKISLKFVPKGLINNISALVQIMAWCRPGDKPLSEPMMVSLLTHICVTLPQWVKGPVMKGIDLFFLVCLNKYNNSWVASDLRCHGTHVTSLWWICLFYFFDTIFTHA